MGGEKKDVYELPDPFDDGFVDTFIKQVQAKESSHCKV